LPFLDQPIGKDQSLCWKSWGNKYACPIFPIPVNDRIELKSPFWLDPNHAPPSGTGYFNLIFYTYLKDNADLGNVNFKDKHIIIRVSSKELDLKESNLYFWVQSKMPDGMYVNFRYKKPFIFNMNQNRIQKIDMLLTTNEKDWECMGWSPNRASTYRCDNYLNVISNVNNDFGFILFPTSSNPDPLFQPSGSIYFYQFGIY